jgi:branched-chain amino acid transport system ATP-binding protein
MTDGTSPELVTSGLTVRYGALRALDDVNVRFPQGEISGLIGPNGAGKTTLLNAISGFTAISEGSISVGDVEVSRLPVRARVRLGIVRGFQTVRLLEREPVWLNVMIGCERFEQPNALSQLFSLPNQIRAARRDRAATDEILEFMSLSSIADRRVDELPFATRRLVEVARVLVSRPSIILLDEPAAGLDQEGRTALVDNLRQLHSQHASTMLVVEHDVEVVRWLCSYAIALASGSVIADGTPRDVLGNSQVQTAYFGKGTHAGH